MNASLLLAAGLACAPIGDDKPPEVAPPAASKIVAVTVYQDQALVTREVSVPPGEGSVELIVSPLPPETVEGSLYSEGGEGLRVLSTRFRTRAVKDDTRREVRDREEWIARARADAERLKAEIAVQEQDLQFLQKLEGFTGAALTGLTEKGRLESEAIVSLSEYVMKTRGAKSKAEILLRGDMRAANDLAEFARRQLVELSAGSSRVERDAVIVVRKARPDPGTIRLGYLVNAASWSPQYRLRGATDNTPVRLEYLASVVQQTGEPWPDVRVTLSTARPSLDAAPPALLPLKMEVDGEGEGDAGPIEARDNRSRRIVAELDRPIDLPFREETSLEDVVKFLKERTKGAAFPEGLPIYVDPVGLTEAEHSLASVVVFDVAQVPLRTSLRLLLKQLDLTYRVEDGLLTITALDSSPQAGMGGMGGGGFGGMGGGMGGMGGGPGGLPGGGAMDLNRDAATDQAAELRLAEGPDAEAPPKDGPSMIFPIAGLLDLPSRREPQLLEVARVELPAESYAKAVPVLTSRVYRLAKVTNRSEFVLLPGEATVYVGSDFVGRMRLPLVAVGEQFIAGFGADPQLQVSRRLMSKSRAVQGGNQVFTYEFRLGLRNYRPGPVKIELWDRLPRPGGEAVAVHLVKTSAELSDDVLYQRTGRMDNLLRWDLEIPQGTVGDEAKYVNYEFRLEYARDLPPPQFVSGGLKEAPIGGGAMGGGMGGGMRSFGPEAPGRP